MKSNVFFDGLPLVEGHFSGIGQYTLGILRGLDGLLDQKKLQGAPVPRIRVIIPRDTRHKFYAYQFKHLEPFLFPMNFSLMSSLWYRGKMPPIDPVCGKGLYIFTRFLTMPLLFSRSAVIVYDISFEVCRQYADEGNARFLSKGTRKSLEQVERVFTISQNAKEEIASFYGTDANAISLAMPAADQRYFYRRGKKEIDDVKLKYGIKGNYILALSNLEPRKNLDTLVDAYCALSDSYRKKTGLLLVGVNGWKTDQLFQKIINLVQQGHNIQRPSEYVSDCDKPAIISGADMLVYPSHYEGFGMPPLEALACGVPVITSDNSSLPEVVGKAGKMLDCNDTKGFSKTIMEYLDDLEPMTKRSITEGPARAAQFSWERSAQVYWDYIMERA